MRVILGSGLCPSPLGAQLPFGIQLYEDEWADDVILVDLGDSCPSCSYTVPTLTPSPILVILSVTP